METTTTPIDSLTPHPRNYRKHPPDQLAHIVESIRAHGLYRPIVSARGVILAGHGLVEALRQMGVSEVPVVDLDIDPASPQALKLLAGDNEISNIAFDDDRLLTEMLREIREADSLLGTGYDEQQLAALLLVTRTEAEIPDLDAAGEWVGLPEYDEGQDRIRLIVSFPSEEERARFIGINDLKIDKKERKTWSSRWPWTGQIDRSSVKLVSAKEKA